MNKMRTASERERDKEEGRERGRTLDHVESSRPRLSCTSLRNASMPHSPAVLGPVADDEGWEEELPMSCSTNDRLTSPRAFDFC